MTGTATAAITTLPAAQAVSSVAPLLGTSQQAKVAQVLLRVVEFVLGGKRAIGYAQGLVVMCTTLQAGLSASGAMHLGKEAWGSKDQRGRPRPRGLVTSRPKMRPTIATLRSCDPGRINLHTSINALFPSVVLLLLHGCEGGEKCPWLPNCNVRVVLPRLFYAGRAIVETVRLGVLELLI